MKFSQILGYRVFAGSKAELFEYLDTFEKVNIISGNPEVLHNGMNDRELFGIFTGSSSVIIPDGVGTVLAARIAGSPVKEKLAGIEVMQGIIERCAAQGQGIYLIGAKEEVVSACAENLKLKYPGLDVMGWRNGYFDIENCGELISDIKEKKPKAVFVAMGSPRQDRFILKYMDELPCRIFMGVGGSFDVISGNSQRAPEWMINTGMEWLYRVSREPWRLKRLSSIPKFLTAVLLHREG
jgi:N-acetylglucosaminyldiphosphoundecaprenol N-acetyl-beta-D-mannosaminyltransferase